MSKRRPGLPVCQRRHVDFRPRQYIHRGMCLAAITFSMVGVATAPSAAADTSANLRDAVAAVRGTSCGPLRLDPVIDKAAGMINETTQEYIDHAARFVPEADALSVLKDLGYGGTKAAILSGASTIDANAIKGILLQGYAKIPDCSYTDIGVSALHNTTKDLILMTVVLAG